MAAVHRQEGNVGQGVAEWEEGSEQEVQEVVMDTVRCVSTFISYC